MKTITEYKIGGFWIIWSGNTITGYLYSAAEVERYNFLLFLEI